ncbi:MAG: cation diffusion facilitator family transporter, partial [Clostridium sp.]
AISSIGSFIGIAGAMLGFPVMDSVASVVICLFILKVAYDILRDALMKMLDTSCGEAYENQLTHYIAEKEDVRSVDLLHSRMFGNKVFIDLEISVDGDKSLRDAHAVAELVHEDVELNFPEIKHIMIHVNPANE